MMAFFSPYLMHPLGQCAGNIHEVTRCKSYNLWSGIGSDISEITLVFMFIGACITAYRTYRKHTECHVATCKNHGHIIHGTPYRACHEHDPRVTHKPGEDITAEHIAEAHALADPAHAARLADA